MYLCKRFKKNFFSILWSLQSYPQNAGQIGGTPDSCWETKVNWLSEWNQVWLQLGWNESLQPHRPFVDKNEDHSRAFPLLSISWPSPTLVSLLSFQLLRLYKVFWCCFDSLDPCGSDKNNKKQNTETESVLEKAFGDHSNSIDLS